jgi:hypothetical protein
MATTTLATTRGTTPTPGLDGWFAVILSPDCGTVAGHTCFLVFYRVAGGIDMAELWPSSRAAVVCMSRQGS